MRRLFFIKPIFRAHLQSGHLPAREMVPAVEMLQNTICWKLKIFLTPWSFWVEVEVLIGQIAKLIWLLNCLYYFGIELTIWPGQNPSTK